MQPPASRLRLRQLCILATFALSSVAHAAEYPVSNAKIRVRYGNPLRQSAVVRGAWLGVLPDTPSFAGATVRIAGAYGQGGTETIALSDSGWTALPNGSGYKYFDRAGLAGGIKSILVKVGRNGRPGTFKISTAKNFDYGHRGAHTRVRAALEIGLDRWCADIASPADDGARIMAAADAAPASCLPDLVVDTTWLQGRLDNPNVQVVDTRAAFSGGHIPGALPLRPESLATTIEGIGFQMMPPALAEPVLSGIGLQRDATVVVYGVSPEYDPARLVWALTYLGHPDVRYLDGGWDAWIAAGGTVTAGVPVAGPPTTYVADPIRPEQRVTSDYVLAEIGPPPYDTPGIQLVDARSSGEYTAGRIPSAELAPWTANLSTGLLKPRADLEALYDALGFVPTQTAVTYCLVGWRASVAWLTLRWLGYDDVRVYDGSWLEWGAGGFPVES